MHLSLLGGKSAIRGTFVSWRGDGNQESRCIGPLEATLRKALQLREPACVQGATTRCESPQERPPAVLIRKEGEEEGGERAASLSACGGVGRVCWSLPPGCVCRCLMEE